MTLPRSVPARPVNGFTFVSEVDFGEYRRRLTRFVGEEGYEPPKPDEAGNRIPRVIGFLDELAAAQEVLTSAETDGVCIVGDEGVGKSALLLSLLNKACLGELSPALLQKAYFTFDIHAFFKLDPPQQVKQFDDAVEFMSKRDGLLIIDRFDDMVASCGADRARRLMSTIVDGIENHGLSAILTAQPRKRVKFLYECFVDGFSTAFAAECAGVHRNTAINYYRHFAASAKIAKAVLMKTFPQS